MLDFEKDILKSPIDDLTISDIAATIDQTGWAAEIYDSKWNLLWISKELGTLLGNPTDYEVGIGTHILTAYTHPVWLSIVDSERSTELLRPIVPYILYDSDSTEMKDFAEDLKEKRGSAEKLREIILSSVPMKPPPVFLNQMALSENPDSSADVQCLSFRLCQDEKMVATVRVYGPGIRASVLNLMTRGDESMIERMSELVSPGQQSVAVLFADIDRSTKLSKQLPTSLYFDLVSKITQKIDEVVIGHKGIVGKHVGDGTSAFFLAKDHGSSSAAARAALVAAEEISACVDRVVSNFVSRLEEAPAQDCKTNIGLHWGDTVYMGQIVSGGRLEVTALGDQVNECARIEQAASGGQILVSKELIERLDQDSCFDLGIDNQKIIYTPVADLSPAPEKSVIDAGNLAVVDIRKVLSKSFLAS